MANVQSTLRVIVSEPRTKLLLSVVVFAVASGLPVLPLTFLKEGGFHNGQRILELLCVTVSLVLSIAVSKRVGVACSKPLILCVSVFFLLGIFSSLASYSPRHAFFEWANFLLLTMLTWRIADEVRPRAPIILNAVIGVIGLGCVAYVLKVVSTYVAFIVVGGQPRAAELIPGFDNYRFFNHVQTISLPFLVLLTLQSDRFRWRYWLWFSGASAWWALLFVTAGRGTFVGLIAGAAVAWIVRRRHALAWLRMMAVSCIAGFIIYLLFFAFVPLSLGLEPFGFLSKVVERTLVNPSSNRTLLWHLAWTMIVDHPLLGAGPLHFAHYGPVAGNGAHPHNWILQIGSEWGIPALIAFSTAVVIAYRRLVGAGQLIQAHDERNQVFLCAWLTIGAAILVDGLVSGLLVMPTSQLWIALYIGCAWGWVSSLSPAAAFDVKERRNPVKVRTGIILVSFVALFLLWNGLYPEILHLKEIEADALKSSLYPDKVLRPRIWRAGYF